LGRLPYVEHVSMLGADFDVLVLVRAPDNAALRDLVLDRIQSIPGVRTTRTWWSSRVAGSRCRLVIA
jgi:DNA-binding Lrp family transcriptional regulator